MCIIRGINIVRELDQEGPLVYFSFVLLVLSLFFVGVASFQFCKTGEIKKDEGTYDPIPETVQEVRAPGHLQAGKAEQ